MGRGWEGIYVVGRRVSVMGGGGGIIVKYGKGGRVGDVLG